MDTKDINADAYSILESEEFDTLLDAVELMAKAQGNLLSLQRSVEELKIMMDNTELSNDDFSLQDNAVLYDALDKVENLVDSLANRFGVLYPDLKDAVKQNISDYGEFLPETFFTEIGTPRVLEVIRNGSEAERKKLFKMLGEVYEDGTNEVQDVIGVTILGAMKNDPALMEVADRYMTDYMSGPVHEINKITARKNRLTKRLANPPAYKPKKKKTGILQNALNQQRR